MTSPDIARLMSIALREARLGLLRVEPNPPVGAVLVRADGGTVPAAHHARFGGPHAEAALLRSLLSSGDDLRGATLFVTLEPCAHTAKKTPPCVPQIVEAGVTRVVVGAPDANPETAGRAAVAFTAAGIEYVVLPESDVHGAACRALSSRYLRHLGADRPWTIAKWASSLDGRVADAAGASRWISGERSRDLVWEFRETCDAVVVGVGTVLADDPQLVSRRDSARRSLRVVIDSRLRTPAEAKLVATARETPTLIVGAMGADVGRRAALEAAGAQVALVGIGGDGRIDLAECFRELHRRGVRRALLEAGGMLTSACLRAGLVDQVAAFIAPMVLGGGGPTPFSGKGRPIAAPWRLEESRVAQVGDDALIEGYWPRD